MQRVFVIAEAGVNHNGDLNVARRLVDAAREAGADAVKFQSFRAKDLVTRTAPMARYQIANIGGQTSQYDMLKALELSVDDHFRLREHCNGAGIEFLSTPFDVGGLHFLVNEVKVARVKIPSGELVNGPLLLEAGRTGLPILLSTGMASQADIRTALSILYWGRNRTSDPTSLAEVLDAACMPPSDTVLLQCTTEYPAPFESLNLRVIPAMATDYGVPVGFSDHSTGGHAAVAAVALGACVIEKHFTLDRSLPGPDHKASLEVAELATMVRQIREVEVAMGVGAKVVQPAEEGNVAIARRSLVAVRAIVRGERFGVDNLGAKRPGTGVSPLRYWDMLGRVAQQDYAPNEPIERKEID